MGKGQVIHLPRRNNNAGPGSNTKPLRVPSSMLARPKLNVVDAPVLVRTSSPKRHGGYRSYVDYISPGKLMAVADYREREEI
jgi:hypothetical protein